MKYLHLVPWSPLGNFGGYETIICSAAEAQKKTGHTVFVIGRTFGEKNGVKISQVDGVEYIEYVSSIKRRPSTLSIGLVGYFLLFAEIFYTLYVLTPLVNKLINKEKIDVVIFYGIHLFPMSFWLRMKKVITLLGLEVIQRNPYTSRLSFLYWFRKIKYNLFSGIFTYTHKFYFADGSVIDNVSLLKSFVKPEKVSYIPWGIEIEKYEKISLSPFVSHLKQQHKKVIICARRLVEEKGVRYLLEGIPDILAVIPNTVIVFTADGILRVGMEKRVKELGIDKSVIFTGCLEYKETLSAIKASDLLVVPSSGEESFGMVFLEAYMLKVPIVTTKFGGIPNVVKNNETGLIVEPRNSKALAKAIINLLDNPKIAKKFVENGYVLVHKEFNLKITLEKLDKFVQILSAT